MLLSLDSVHKTYQSNGRAVQAVVSASFSLEPGEFVALQGKSGCGKSTLLLVAGGLLRPDQGSVQVVGEDLYLASAARRAAHRAKHIGFVFQQFHLVPYLNVLENVMAVRLAGGGSSPAETRSKAEELVARFGLTERAGHRPKQLSTGERQRTALARALMNDPELILADEPTGNLDPENAGLVLSQLSAFAKNGGGVLLVTHDRTAADRAQRRVRMSDGELQYT